MPLTKDEELELKMLQQSNVKQAQAPSTGGEIGPTISKTLFPASTASAEQGQEFGFTPPPRQPNQSDEDYKKVVEQWQSGNRETFGNAISDAGSMVSRAAGSIASKLGMTSATGGVKESIAQGMQDPQTSYMRAPKEYLANVFSEHFKGLKDSDKALVDRAKDLAVMALSGAGYIGSVAAEDPTTVASLGGMAIEKAAPSLVGNAKTTVGKLSGVPVEALDRASITPAKTIEAAAGTEDQIAKDLVSKTTGPGEDAILDPAIQTARDMEKNSNAKVILQPSANAVQQKLPAYSIDETGQLVKSPDAIDHPISMFKGKLQDKAWEVKAQNTLNAIQDQFNFFQDKLGKTKTMAPDEMRKTVRQWQNASKYNDVNDNDYNQFMKALAASGRMALEDAMVQSGKGPDYIKAMRDLSTKTNKLSDIQDWFGRDPREFTQGAEKTVSKIGAKTSKQDLQQLQDMDRLISEATGVKSDLADRALNAYTAKKLGVEPGGKIPLFNNISNGRSVLGASLGLAGSGLIGIKPTLGAGLILGAAATSPKAAVITTRALNLMEAASQSQRLKTLVTALASASTSAAAEKLTAAINKEMQSLQDKDISTTNVGR